MEEELAFYRALVDSSPTGIAAVDLQGRQTYVNRTFCQMVGWSAEELTGADPPFVYWAPEDRERIADALEQTLRDEIPPEGFELLFQRRNGERFDALVLPMPLRDAEGQVSGYVATVYDYTAHKRRDREREAALAELQVRQRIVQAILGTLDLEERVNLVLDELMSLLKVEFGCVYVTTNGRLLMCAQRGLPTELCVEWQQLHLEEEPWVYEVSRHRERLTERGGFIPETAKQVGIRACAHLPLKVGERLVGLLRLGSRRYEAFSDEEMNALVALADQMAVAIENARLYTEAQQRLTRLSVLREIDRAIVSHLSLREVIGVVLERVPRELGAEAVAVSLFDELRRRMQAFAMRLPNGTIIEEEAFALAENLLYWLVERKEPVVIYNLAEDPRVTMHREVIRHHHLASYLGVPLVVRDEVIGLLHILTTTPRRFSDEEIAFFTTLGGQTAIAVENARLYEEAARRAHALEQIIAGCFRLAQSEAEERLKILLEMVQRAVGVEGASYFAFDATTRTFTWVYGYGFSKEEFARAEEQLRFQWGDDSLVSLVALSGQPIYLSDCHADPRWKQEVNPRIRSAYFVPLLYGERLFGVLVLLATGPGGIRAVQRSVAEVLAHYAAAALENARLYAELRYAYEDLRATQQQVLRQERLHALGQMASGIAHDFNNALSPILGYADLALQREDLDERLRRWLETIHTAASDAAAMVARMREFYRPHSKREQEQWVSVEVNALVEEVVQLTEPRWKNIPQEKGIVITIRKDWGTAGSVLGNPAELREALINLVFNAVDAMPQGGTLTLRTYTEGVHAVIEIADTGVGMSEEVQQRVFEPFFSTKGGKGTGLGLSMVYGTIQRHRGDIEMESAEGQGTRVRLFLPLSPETTALPEETAETLTRPLRILHIDDEPRVGELIREMLTPLGHQVELAYSGAEGIERFRTGQFEVVITDLGMPGLSGREVARAIKMLSPETPVILLTGWADQLRLEGKIPAEVDKVIPKPTNLRLLRDALAAVTGRETAEPP